MVKLKGKMKKLKTNLEYISAVVKSIDEKKYSVVEV